MPRRAIMMKYGKHVCHSCDIELATCRGAYEGRTKLEYGCDICCGHGCEDGHCIRLTGAPVYEGTESMIDQSDEWKNSLRSMENRKDAGLLK